MARSWQTCSLSNGEIDRSGVDLAKGFENDLLRYLEAYEKMDQFRRSHAFPLNTLQMTLRQRARRVSARAIVAQRLKRAESIISKIQREERMKLSRMQDIGGCRAILPNVTDVRRVVQLYDISRDRHVHAGYKDYIESPRPSGYRGYHIVLKYLSDRDDRFNGRRIEIQIRSRRQHYWATSVEIADFLQGSRMKADDGPADWLEFFSLASQYLAHRDKCATPNNLTTDELKEKLKISNEEGRFIERLQAFRIAQDHIVKRTKESRYFIIKLDLKKKMLNFRDYKNLQVAEEIYKKLEVENKDNSDIDVVLVKGGGAAEIRKAYPN